MKKDVEPIELDIYFPDGFSATDVVHLAIELLKTLLLQRHQIPLPIDKVRERGKIKLWKLCDQIRILYPNKSIAPVIINLFLIFF